MRIAVNGAAGAMGRRVVNLIGRSADCTLVAAMDRADHPDQGKDAGTLAGTELLGVSLRPELDVAADVVIDFSSPGSALACAETCAERGIAIAIGTTGLSDAQRAAIKDRIAPRTPVLVAANMSLGVNLMLDLVARVAASLPDGYDVEIVETHHRRKKDSPSGTALELAARLRAALDLGEDALIYGRHGQVDERPARQIAIHAVRGGDIVGEHTVIFAGQGERIELTHRAQSRDVFAHGALRAARFLMQCGPGLYSMNDVLR